MLLLEVLNNHNNSEIKTKKKNIIEQVNMLRI